MSLTIQQKKSIAQDYFVKLLLTQKEVASRVGVSEKTMVQWVKAGKWDELRTSMLITKDQQIRNLYAQLNELTSEIAQKPEGKRYPDAKEADSQVKIASAIKQLESELGVSEIIDVGKLMVELVRIEKPALVTPVVEAVDLLIKSKTR
jgi:DNA-binding XRE family transcriptional regulator